MGHRTEDRGPTPPRATFRRRFLCPECGRLLPGQKMVIHSGEGSLLRAVFPTHRSSPTKRGACPRSGRPVDEVPNG